MDGTTSSATVVPLGALQWYRFEWYDGTAYSAMMVPLRRYYHFYKINNKENTRLISESRILRLHKIMYGAFLFLSFQLIEN